MSFEIALTLYAVVVGLIIGSYLNVVIHRLPRRESTVFPRSRCPSCGAPIRAVDNVPILSHLLLGGRCRHCRAPISWRYPLVESGTALLFVACFRRFGIEVETLVALTFGCLMIALAAIDFEHFLLPDRLTLTGLGAGLLIHLADALLPGPTPLISWATLSEALVGAVVGGGVLLAMAETWLWLKGEQGMGMGDVKMLAMIGAFLGWKGALVALFVAALAGAATGVALMVLGRADMRSRLPFGSFLAAGGLVALFAGRALVDAYLGLRWP